MGLPFANNFFFFDTKVLHAQWRKHERHIKEQKNVLMEFHWVQEMSARKAWWPQLHLTPHSFTLYLPGTLSFLQIPDCSLVVLLFHTFVNGSCQLCCPQPSLPWPGGTASSSRSQLSQGSLLSLESMLGPFYFSFAALIPLDGYILGDVWFKPVSTII